MGAVGAQDVDVTGDDHGEQLLAGPQRLRLQDRRLGNLTVIPRGQLHQQVHNARLQTITLIPLLTIRESFRKAIEKYQRQFSKFYESS